MDEHIAQRVKSKDIVADPRRPPVDDPHNDNEWQGATTDAMRALRLYVRRLMRARKAGVRMDTVAPPPRLPSPNGEQAAGLELLTDYLNAGPDGDDRHAPLLLVHGGPGVGKTFYIHAIMAKALQSGHGILPVAANASASSLLPGGLTIHSAVAIPIDTSLPGDAHAAATRQHLSPLKEHSTQFDRALHNLGDADVLIIDEISAVPASLLGALHLRLVQLRRKRGLPQHVYERPFGGMAVIALGDFHQMAPVQNNALHAEAVLGALRDRAREADSKRAGKDKNEDASIGRRVFKHFRKIELTQQMRAQGDEEHCAFINAWRDPTNATAFPKTTLDQIKRLSEEDMRADSSWAWAPVVVTNNEERHALNKASAVRFGRFHNRPVLRWRKTIDLPSFSKDDMEDLFDDHASLWQYFVVGAPAVLTHNINAPRGLANGTPCTLHSVSFPEANGTDTQRIVALEQRYREAAPGEVITVDDDLCPTYVTVELPHIDARDWPEHDTIEPGKVVVPIGINRNSKTRIASVNGHRSRMLNPMAHSYDMAFAITYWKVQGHTLDKVVLDLNKTKPRIAIQMLYVGMTRTRKREHIRIVPSISTPDALDYVTAIPSDPFIAWWAAGYDEHGRWDDARALAAYDAAHPLPPRPSQPEDEGL